MPPDKVVNTEFLGILVQWQEYDVQIDVAFDAINQALDNKPVKGMAEFKTALKNQVIRDKTVLSAMKAQQDTMQLFPCQTAELYARTKRENELLNVAKSINAKQ